MADNGERWHFPNDADAEGEPLPNLRSGELQQGNRPSSDAIEGTPGSDLQSKASAIGSAATPVESLENVANEALMQNLKRGAVRLGIFSVFDLSGKHAYAAFQNLLPAPRVVSPSSMWNRAANMTQNAKYSYRAKGMLPPPDVIVGTTTNATHGWLPKTIDDWNASRPSRSRTSQ